MPGQIELYTHLTAGKDLVKLLQSWNFNVCSVFLIDSQFIIDGAKFLSGTMAALTVMANIELPNVNVLTKIDLLSKTARSEMEKYIEPDPHALLGDDKWFGMGPEISQTFGDEENISDLLMTIDNILQCGEDADTKTKDFEQPDPEDGDDIDQYSHQ